MNLINVYCYYCEDHVNLDDLQFCDLCEQFVHKAEDDSCWEHHLENSDHIYDSTINISCDLCCMDIDNSEYLPGNRYCDICDEHVHLGRNVGWDLTQTKSVAT